MTQSPKGQKPSPKRKEKRTDKAQSERFMEAARDAGVDGTEEEFADMFSKTVTLKPR